MARTQFFIHVHGIQYLFGTRAIPIDVGTPWAGYTMLGNVISMSEFDYNLDPIKLKLKVGSVGITLLDDDDTLTSLFGWRQDTYRGFLDSTIQQSDSMTGAGTITVSDAIPAGTAPCYLYIERETFYATGQSGSDFTGVTRAEFDSIPGLHIGYTGDDGYRPSVTTFPEYWAGRVVDIYRVDETDLDANEQLNGSCTKVWSGPLLDLSNNDINTWTLKIGSIMRLLDVELPRQQHGLTIGYTTGLSDTEIVLTPSLETIISGLATTAAGTTTTTICTDLNEPDNYWCSQYAVYFTSGSNAGYYAPILSWDNATGTLTHLALPTATALSDGFKIVRYNNLIPVHVFDYDRLFIGETSVNVSPHLPSGATSMNNGIDGLAEAWKVWGAVDYSRINQGDEALPVLSNWAIEDGTKKHIHPLRWFLYLAISTGQGWNSTTYDILPWNYGAAIPAEWIDVSGIEEIIDTAPYAERSETKRLEWIYKEPTKLSEVLKQICAFMGLYPTIDSGGKLALKKVRQYTKYEAPDSTITQSHIIGLPKLEQSHTGLLQGIKYRFNYHPYRKVYQATAIVRYVATREMYPQAKLEEIKINTWSGDVGYDGDVAAIIRGNVDEISERYLRPAGERLLARLGRPVYTVTIQLPLQDTSGTAFGEVIYPGDLIELTLDQIPLPSGGRGATSELFEVRGIKKDQIHNLATLKLYWLPYDKKGGAWNFAAEVTSYNGTTGDMTVDDSLFPSGNTASDYLPTMGGTIRIHYLDQSRAGTVAYGTTELLNYTSYSGNTLTIDIVGTPPTYTPIAGDLITTNDYDNVPGLTIQKLAFFASAGDSDIYGDETVGASGDQPYVFD